MNRLTLTILLALAVIGVIGLTQTPSNLVCSGMVMALPLWLALRAWREEVDQ